MPELPEVETTVRGLRRLLQGRTITTVQTRIKKLRFALPRALAKRLENAHVTAIDRRAKYILVRLAHGETLLVHLGMTGRLYRAPHATPAKHDHVIFTLDNHDRLTFSDPRRFGAIDLFVTAREHTHKMLRPLGPEPLGADFIPAYLQQKLKNKKTAIKVALLDQHVVAGLGNIYASEALYWAGIHPERLAGTLSKKEIEKLIPAIQNVLHAAIKAGGTSMRDYVQADGALGFFQDQFAVYDRAGKPCPGCTCKKSVQQLVQAGRSTYFCPKKQR